MTMMRVFHIDIISSLHAFLPRVSNQEIAPQKRRKKIKEHGRECVSKKGCVNSSLYLTFQPQYCFAFGSWVNHLISWLLASIVESIIILNMQVHSEKRLSVFSISGNLTVIKSLKNRVAECWPWKQGMLSESWKAIASVWRKTKRKTSKVL